MRKQPLRCGFKPYLLSLLLWQSALVYGSEYVEFNPAFLYRNQDAQTVDISRFNYGNPVPEGRYISDVYLNNKLRGRIALVFSQPQGQNKVVLCADSALLTLLDLKETAFSNQKMKGDCQPFEQKVIKAKAHFNFGELRLDVDIPQAFIVQRPRGYISPSQWQEGVPVAFIRYDANYYRYQYGEQHSEQTYLGLNAGVNLFGWAIRHRGSLSWANQKRLPYQSISIYAQREIAALRGQLTIGDFYTSGVLMDNIAIRGVQLSSDERMLASSVRGYAPIVRGVANGNAVVRISQNGVLLREVNVPAGAFEIDDLFPVGYGGDLNVEVLEADGTKQTFRIPYTTVAQLIRPGYSRYQFAAGRYRYGNQIFDEKVTQASWQYGLNNTITLNLGATLAKNYHSELVGFALNSSIGTFAANATFSSAYLRQIEQQYKGYNLSFSYNTRLEPTDTNITLANYRYLSRDYYSLQDVMFANNPKQAAERVIFQNNGRPKNHLQLAINQVLSDKWGSAYLSVSRYTYWGTNDKQTEFQFSYGNHFKQLSYNLSISQTQGSRYQRERLFYLNLSMPLGSNNNAYVSQTLSFGKNNTATSYTSVSGTIGEESNYSYGIAFSTTKQQGMKRTQSLSINQSYLSPFAQLNGSYSRSRRGDNQLSLGVSGSVVAHPKGITLANELGDSFAIIHAKGASGAKISGSIGNQIDYFGNGIVPYVSPYSINYIGLESLPERVELSSTEQQIIPKANQAVLVNFATKVGAVVYFEIQNGEHLPPMGTEVFDQENNFVGIVAQGGRIYSRGIAQTGKLMLHWGDKQCVADYQVPKSKGDKPLIVPIKCQFY